MNILSAVLLISCISGKSTSKKRNSSVVEACMSLVSACAEDIRYFLLLPGSRVSGIVYVSGPADKPADGARDAHSGGSTLCDDDTLLTCSVPRQDVVSLTWSEDPGKMLKKSSGRRRRVYLPDQIHRRCLIRAIREGVENIVILGAGLDTRAYRLPTTEQLRFFEVDLPEIQEIKKKRLKRYSMDLQATCVLSL